MKSRERLAEALSPGRTLSTFHYTMLDMHDESNVESVWPPCGVKSRGLLLSSEVWPRSKLSSVVGYCLELLATSYAKSSVHMCS